MNNLAKFVLPMVCLLPLSSYAALTHVAGNEFSEEGITIKYPCSGGGEPLVIYSTPIDNRNPISSQKEINPLYVKQGYEADTLKVSELAQTSKKSPNFLIVQSPNPGDEYHKVEFGLTRLDGNPFFVNTVNFASVESTEKDKYVSMISVFGDEKTIAGSAFPFEEYWFVQDSGIFVFQKLKRVSGEQYTWNQNTHWKDGQNLDSYSTVKYRFTTKQSDDIPTLYNGFGYWICGQDQAPENMLKFVETGKFFQDKKK